MGTAAFGIPTLEALSRSEFKPIAIVTVPDKPAGRGQRVMFSPVKLFATERNIPVYQPDRLKDPRFISAMAELQPDCFVVVAFRILPPELLRVPKIGSINLHASLLPKYRGAAPIQRAIMNGERETGVTTFLLDEKIDTGKIIVQARTQVGENETAGDVHDRLSLLGVDAMLGTLNALKSGKPNLHAQDDSQATPAPKIFKDECRIDWTKDARTVHNFIRGLSPRPGAFTHHNGVQLKIYRSQLAGKSEKPAGEVVETNGSLKVSTGNGAIEIIQIQQEGKKALGTEEFVRGYSLRKGDRFE